MPKNSPEYGRHDIAGHCDGYLDSVLAGIFAVERVGAKPVYIRHVCVTREDRNGKTFRVPEPELACSSCTNLLAAKQKTICQQQQAARISHCKSGQMMVAILRKHARHRFLGGVFLGRLVFGDVLREACLGGLFEPASTMHILCRVYLPQWLAVRNDRGLPSSLDVSLFHIVYSFNALSTQHRCFKRSVQHFCSSSAIHLQLICQLIHQLIGWCGAAKCLH
jgi:hypothetical protein